MRWTASRPLSAAKRAVLLTLSKTGMRWIISRPPSVFKVRHKALAPLRTAATPMAAFLERNNWMLAKGGNHRALTMLAISALLPLFRGSSAARNAALTAAGLLVPPWRSWA